MAKDPQWGSGAARGRRIPDSQDKPIEKRDNGPTLRQSAVWDGRFGFRGQQKGKAERREMDRSSLKGAAAGALGGGAAGTGIGLATRNRTDQYHTDWGTHPKSIAEVPSSVKRKLVHNRAGAGAFVGAAALSTVAAQRKRHEIQHRPNFGKAMTSSAMSHMLPKAAGAMKPLAPESAKPVTTLGLKKTGGSLGSVAKARHFDPEAARQRRLGMAEAATVGGGGVLAYQGGRGVQVARSGKKITRVSLPMNRKVAGKLGAGLGLLAVGRQVDRFANSTAGRGYR